ncbi:MAG: 23S rRNA (adenine(2503)-C(2))-methyltransferase RlmN, partial [Brachybacterium sp.]
MKNTENSPEKTTENGAGGKPAPEPVALSRNPDLSREAIPGQKIALAPGQLQMKPARRGKPPVHLADLTLAERVEAVKAMGLPGFRAKQLSVHYFEH